MSYLGSHGFNLITLVLATTVMQLFAAYLLNTSANAYKLNSGDVYFLLFFGLAILIHGSRFLVWLAIHKKFKLSSAYPLTAIYFPLIYIFSIFMNEADFRMQKMIGSILIFTGVYFLIDIENNHV